MLLVDTYVDKSPLHGLGLFAKQRILKGTLIWKFEPQFDQKFSIKEIEKMPPPAKKQILHYGYLSNESTNYILCSDNARFFNHSDNPNVTDDASEEGPALASRDIEEGEELTCNYWAFDADTKNKLNKAESL